MTRTRRAFVILVGLMVTSFHSPAAIPIGSWRTHFSYNDVSQVECTPNGTYAVANGKLFSFDQNGHITTHTTLSGLNGSEVAEIKWSESIQGLFVSYSDGNIDLLQSGIIRNLPDFRNKPMTADKTVYSVRIDGSTAYMSTGVGLLVINLVKREISELYKPLLTSVPYTIQETVYDAVSLGDSIFLATPAGLYAGNKTDNLLDPSKWYRLPFIAEAPISVVNFDDKLLVLTGSGSVYMRTNGSWVLLHVDATAYKLTVEQERLIVCSRTSGAILHKDGYKQLLMKPLLDLAFSTIEPICYVASGKGGIIKFESSNQPIIQLEIVALPSGPSQSSAWNGLVHDGDYIAVPGGRWGDRFRNPGDVMRFNGSTWSGIANVDSISYKAGVPFMDIMNLAIDPTDSGHFFLTSWGEGLYEFKDNRFDTLHNQHNSPLISVLPGSFCRIDGAVFDEEGNLWVLNSTFGVNSVLSDTTIWVLKAGGTEWKSMYYRSMPGAPTWGSLLFTSIDQIWCNSVRGASYGLFVIDRKGTPWNTGDDRTRWINSITDGDGTISPFAYTCMVEDKTGTIWIGTNEGPILATNPYRIFEPDYTFTRVKVPRNDGSGLADYLLKGIRINAIAVDGANRKWLGTAGNGLYLVSANGLETIHAFNTDNSPLPSNYIFSVTVHPETGEVFIGTNEGLVSFRAEATEGKDDFSAVRVFPNPVTPGYAGMITVTGLEENTQVRITDVNGNALVAGTSLGGQFSWNGRNRQGNRVASGVYLVFCSSQDGMEHQVGKFMVLK